MKSPICKKEIPQTDKQAARYFPFCSDRCRLIDLGRWLDGKYQIPVDVDEDQSSAAQHEDRQ